MSNASNTRTLLDVLKQQNGVIGHGILIVAGPYTITSTTPIPIVYGKNTSTTADMNLHFSEILVSTAGVNITAVPEALVTAISSYAAIAPPTSGYVVSQIFNSDSSSTFVPPANLFVWDGTTAGGMVLTANTWFTVTTVACPLGVTTIDFKGATIIPPGASFGVALSLNPGSPATSANYLLVGYFRDDS